MPTNPTPITALPAAPDRADRATFSARAVAMFDALKNVFVGEANALGAATYSNAVQAAASATSAQSNASLVAEAAGAQPWVSGTSYIVGNAVWSPANRLIYRRTVAGAGITDPSADSANWALIAGPLAGFLNRIINGGFDVWQRGTSFAGVNGVYTADRFYISGGAVSTISKSASPDSPNGCYWLKATTSATTYLNIYQALERDNVYKLRGKTVTVSFYARASAGTYVGSMSTSLYYSNTTDALLSVSTAVGNIATTSRSLTASAQLVSATFVVPADAVGLVVVANGNSNQPNTVTVDYSEFQLEVGSVATPFQQRPYGTELALCQRYFERMAYASGSVGPSGGFAQNSTTCYLSFPISPKRSAATVAVSGAGAAHVFYSGGTTTAATPATPYGIADRAGQTVMFTTAAVLTTNQTVQLYAIGGQVNVDFTAEL